MILSDLVAFESSEVNLERYCLIDKTVDCEDGELLFFFVIYGNSLNVRYFLVLEGLMCSGLHDGLDSSASAVL